MIAKLKGEGAPAKPQDVIRRLVIAADPPKKSGSPKRSGSADAVVSASGAPVLRINGKKGREVSLTLLLAGGASRSDAETALGSVLDTYWPKPTT